MAITDIDWGTVTLTNGSKTVTGAGTSWVADEIRDGDTFVFVEGADGFQQPIVESVQSNTSLTLRHEWEGPTLTLVTYTLRYQWDSSRVSAMSRRLIMLLENGNLTAFSQLTGPGIAVFTGPHSMEVRPFTDFVNGVHFDVQVDTLADRDAYDGQTEGFTVLVSDMGDGRSAVFTKNSDAVGDWSDAAFVTGPVGPVADFQIGSTTTLPPGEEATVDITPTSDGYSLDFGIPSAEGFEPRGDYSSVTTYIRGDVVQYEGSSWVAIQTTSGNTPPSFPVTSNSFWNLLARRGNDGSGTVTSIVAGDGIFVDSSDPTMPVISSSAISSIESRQWAIDNFHPESAPNSLRTGGYSVAGDGGEALYKKVSSEPTHFGKFSITLANSSVVWYEISDSVLNVRSFGAIPGVSHADMYSRLDNAWLTALNLGRDLYHPAGTYEIGENNFPYRQKVGGFTELLDCKNITIYGDGPNSVLYTNSVGGADVLQLYGLKNITFRDIRLKADVSGSASGSNGISIVGGWDNVQIYDVHIGPLRGLDKGDSIDGGKALTLQSEESSLPCGRLVARIYAEWCAEGFGFENNLTNALTKDTTIDVTVFAKRCYQAVKLVAGAATGPVPNGPSGMFRVNAFATDCQHGVVANRVHGCDINLTVNSSVVLSTKRTDFWGNFYRISDSIVDSVLLVYAKNSNIIARGNSGLCTYKAQIGATTAGSSGQDGSTSDCHIILDLSGTPVTTSVPIAILQAGGSSLKNSILEVSTATASLSQIPSPFFSLINSNEITVGASRRLINPKLGGRVSLYSSPPSNVEAGALDVFDTYVTGLQGKYTSSGGAVIAGLYDSSGLFRLGILNGNGIVIDTMGTSSPIGAYVGKHPIYNKTGALIGYIPIYL